jgi:hypothetical protein
MTSRGGRICFDSSATSCEQRKESPINLLRNVRSGSTGPFIACLRDARSWCAHPTAEVVGKRRIQGFFNIG